MIAPNPKVLCEQAESYYYDFLCKVDTELIPESVFSHIKQCAACQEQVNKLRAVLSVSEEYLESGQREAHSTVTEMLKLHFAHIGEPVTCDIVKPFLPSLLDKASEIKIPTPITTHLDNCRQCSEDLETIRNLNLSHKQIRRLSQLFAEKPAESDIDCKEAQGAIPSVTSMIFSKTSTTILKHLCTCPDCRELLYQRREMVLRGLLKTKGVRSKFPCKKVSAKDFFDYVIPYGINPANDQYAKFRESLTSHLRTCPTCLTKMQRLHNAIYGIAERTESEVVTIYHIDESAKVTSPIESNDLYAGFPISVEVINREDEVSIERPVSTVDFKAALRQRPSATKPRPLLKTAIPAAAAILVAVTILLNIHTAQAAALKKIYKALEEVKNVYISSFVPEKTGPMQEKWVSRTLNIYMTKTAEQCVFWDAANEVTKIRHLDTGTVETTRLSAENISSIEEKISGSLDLMPFYGISDVPADAEWSRVADDELKAVPKGTEVYDLTWVRKKYGGPPISRRWRIFVDAETSLPQRIEWYEKLPTDTDYILGLATVIEYIGDSEMEAVIQEYLPSK